MSIIDPLIKHEEGSTLPYLALPDMCCWTEYAGFQGLESQAASQLGIQFHYVKSVFNRVSVKDGNTQQSKWVVQQNVFKKSNSMVLLLKILNSVCETKWIRVTDEIRPFGLNKEAKWAIFVLNKVTVWSAWRHTPTQTPFECLQGWSKSKYFSNQA